MNLCYAVACLPILILSNRYQPLTQKNQELAFGIVFKMYNCFINKRNLTIANEIKEFNQPEESNQSEPEKAENVDNRLPYETPKLRKHGKVNDATKFVPVPGIFDGPFGPAFDIS